MSDIHANLTALNAVLADAAGDWDHILCLGDIVGYGPEPNECVGRLAGLPVTAVAGNHDWAAIGRMDIAYFNRPAQQALVWTRSRLDSASVEFLGSLKPVRIIDSYISLFHGALTGPITDYILNPQDAEENFRLLTTPVGLFGHSHVRFHFSRGTRGETRAHELHETNSLNTALSRHLLNPGSTGQAREGDPRASYAILDTDRELWHLRRTEYDIPAVQQRMRQQGLPEYLVERLARGR